MNNKAFTIKDSIVSGWRHLSANFWFFVLLSLSFGIIQALLDKVGGNQALVVVAGILNFFCGFFAMFTFVRMGLKVERGEKPAWKDVFDIKTPVLGWYILTSIVFAIACGAGLLLFIIPGLIVSVRYGFFGFALIENETTLRPAFQRSFDLTHGRFWPILGWSVVLGLINLVGALAFGIGLLITAPLTLLATAHVYTKLKAAPAIVPAAPTTPSIPPAPVA